MSNNKIAAASNDSIYPVEWLIKKYTIHIADNTGHTTTPELVIDEAVEEIIKNAESNARWVFINGKKFEFYAGDMRTEENNQKLRAELDQILNPEIMLTGILAGGNTASM